ncbi:hypothetical protein CVT24_011280 [Panaeolus cyanescens]|uniref:Pyruvate decarboxylase n=1 Tax=Panaeolus cyanescens TaxID=181874 RepID=A0A409YUW0_9AGAR|nr:hypothetical protein CVT24_011280 [Panaeolus cyanescens]
MQTPPISPKASPLASTPNVRTILKEELMQACKDLQRRGKGKSPQTPKQSPDSNSKMISVADYLLERLAQRNVTSMFGLPGDFNLGFLDYVEDHPKINWVGNCNELNAAYAADGYARVRSGSLGVITTTFGVGELSAMNGIAGAFSEMVPVLHIVGVPSTSQQKNRPMLHHTLGDGRYQAYQTAATQVTIWQEYIGRTETAAEQIDLAITKCITEARPVYLALPTDMAEQKISSERLCTQLSDSQPPNNVHMEEFVLKTLYDLVQQARGNVVVLADACIMRQGIQNEVTEFLHLTGFPVFATPMGKTSVDETWERYGGIYVGELSNPEIKEAVENAKLVISIGSIPSDYNTGNFTYNIPKERYVELHSSWAKVQHGLYEGLGMKQLLPKLAQHLREFRPLANKIEIPRFESPAPQEKHNKISHAWFWPRISSFFREKDVIVTETGTSNFGILVVPLPKGSILVSQILWGSIGWSVGSCLGAALAARDEGLGRVILFVGEGSVQLTVQEISPMIKNGLKPIIFLLNNNGYTIERKIHGKYRKYNDVSNWKWSGLLDVLNDNEAFNTESFVVESKEEVDKLLNGEKLKDDKGIRLVEVRMDTLDAPKALERQATASKK